MYCRIHGRYNTLDDICPICRENFHADYENLPDIGIHWTLEMYSEICAIRVLHEKGPDSEEAKQEARAYIAEAVASHKRAKEFEAQDREKRRRANERIKKGLFSDL